MLKALRLKALLERHHSQPWYKLETGMSWKGRWGSNARAEAWRSSWPKEKKPQQDKPKKEKADNLVLRYHDGTKIDTTIGGASASLVSPSQTSGLQEENKKLREAVKALAEKTDLSAVESADEIRKLVETDPRTVLREQQKELNKLKKELTKKEKIEKQIKEKTDNHTSWRAGIMEGVKRADTKYTEEIKKLKEELAQVEDDKDAKDGIHVEDSLEQDGGVDGKLEDMNRKMYQMASYVETMEQRNQDLAYQVSMLLTAVKGNAETLPPHSPQYVKPPARAAMASVSAERTSRTSRERSRSPCRIEVFEGDVNPLTHQAVQEALSVLTPEHQEHVLAIVKAEPEKFPTVETIVILTQQMLAQMTKVPEEAKIIPSGRGPLQPFWNSKDPIRRFLPHSGKGRARAASVEDDSNGKEEATSPLNAMTL